MTELNYQEIAVLNALANEWKKSGPPAFLETTALAQALKITILDARSIIHSIS